MYLIDSQELEEAFETQELVPGYDCQTPCSLLLNPHSM